MSRFVLAAAGAVLLMGAVLANAQTQGTDGAQEESIKTFEHADTLSLAQGVSIITPLPMETDISEPQARELVAVLGNPWPSLAGEAKLLLRWRSNA